MGCGSFTSPLDLPDGAPWRPKLRNRPRLFGARMPFSRLLLGVLL
jgi:hypothetical protein